MTKEELEGLQVERQYYKTALSELSGTVKTLKKQLNEILGTWEVYNKKYTELDRAIAMATKVKVIGKKKPETSITPQMAQELLAVLGYTNKELIEKEEDLSDEEVELLCGEDTV